MSYLEDYYNQTPSPGQEFGAPRDGGKRTHQGADFSHSTRPGTVNVPIVEQGKVTGNYWSDGYGWRVEIGPWSYSHLEYQSLLRVGTTYAAGTIVGTEGDTGATFGSCMHIEYVKNGKKVDPVPVIRSIFSGSTAGNESKPQPKKEDEDEMKIFSVGLSFFFATSRGMVGVRNEQELELLRKFLKSEPGAEPAFNAAERDVINYYLTAKPLTWDDLNPKK